MNERAISRGKSWRKVWWIGKDFSFVFFKWREIFLVRFVFCLGRFIFLLLIRIEFKRLLFFIVNKK